MSDGQRLKRLEDNPDGLAENDHAAVQRLFDSLIEEKKNQWERASAALSPSRSSRLWPPEIDNIESGKDDVQSGTEVIRKKFLCKIRGLGDDDLPATTVERLMRSCFRLAWYIERRLTHGAISERECARSKSFENVALELLGEKYFHLAPVLLQAMAAVMHELIGSESANSGEILIKCVRSVEEGRFPDLENVIE